MKSISKILLLLSVIIFVCYSCKKDDTVTDPYTQIERDINSLVNQHRLSIGKKALNLNLIIYNQAKGHSNNMAVGTVPYSHDGFNDRVDYIKKYFGGSAFGENVNIAYTNPTAKSVVDSWLASSGHKANIEGDYNYTAIGAAISSDGTSYYTQIFIKK